jgi:HAD superfamily hydrolase (TIGR01549 family)
MQVLSLDLDDTLWPVAPVIEAAERDLYAWMQRTHPAVAEGHSVQSMRALRAAVATEYPAQAHDLTFLRREALARQFRAASHDAAHADHALEVFLAARNRVELYPDVRPALERLRGKYRLFALSNGNADLTRCGLAQFFEGHVTARSAGAAKPDARIFARLLSEADVRCADVLHVGDDPLTDVDGAVRAGLQAVWLNRDARPWPGHLSPPPCTLTSLSELL